MSPPMSPLPPYVGSGDAGGYYKSEAPMQQSSPSMPPKGVHEVE